MMISIGYLKRFLNLDVSNTDIMNALINIGHEVAGFRQMDLGNIVIGELLHVDEHPNASKLTICKVDVSSEVLTIVCGAPNHKRGDRVVVAKIGSKLPNGVEISKVALRGVESQGMLCSGEELGLSDDGEGILILPKDAPLGIEIGQYFFNKDVILDLDITPNRGDSLSHIGIARELSAYFKVNMKEEAMESGYEEKGSDSVKVEILTKEVISYICRVVKNVKVEDSPLWLSNFLFAMNTKSINNVVDISNYILYMLGHPIHIFDMDKIVGSVETRFANAGEKILTLEGKEVELCSNDLVVADKEKVLAIAGVIGGVDSAVTEATKNILVEVANFDSKRVRATSKKYGISTESSRRFERGVDKGDSLMVMDATLSLLAKISKGEASEELSGSLNEIEVRKLEIDLKEMGSFLGADIPQEEVVEILDRLELLEEYDDYSVMIKVPSYRHDISRKEDIYEEVVRVFGYNKIGSSMPHMAVKGSLLDSKSKNESRAKLILSSLGLNEVINYSFIPEESPFLHKDGIKLLNPINDEMKVMRTSTLHSLVKNVVHNLNNGENLVQIFEVSRVFLDGGEKHKVGIAISGKAGNSLYGKGESVDFFTLKGVVEAFLNNIGIEPIFAKDEMEEFHFGKSAKILFKGESIGIMGELHPLMAERYDVKNEVFLAEIDLDLISQFINGTKQYSPVVRSSVVERDLALLVDKEVEASSIVNKAKEMNFIKDALIVDLYEGEQVEEGKKCLSLKLNIQSEKSLKEEEIKGIINKFLREANSSLGAKLRWHSNEL